MLLIKYSTMCENHECKQGKADQICSVAESFVENIR